MRKHQTPEGAKEWSVFSIMGAFGIIVLLAPSDSPYSALWQMDIGDIALIAFSVTYAMMYLGWGMMQWHLYKMNKLWRARFKRSIFLSISVGLFLISGLYTTALLKNAPHYSPPKKVCTCDCS
ncbi:MAG: hypothetical protein HYV32_02740 [Candidatus Kerfeldbacteria bacterium]|nr:hypothetical protein [Candidatus Kerfeldbacteria bacterium]